jgi:hypothetical protein
LVSDKKPLLNKYTKDAMIDFRLHSFEKRFLIKISGLALYIILFILIFAGKVQFYAIFWMTFLLTAISLWYGPLSLLSIHSNRQIFDPAIIFNSAIFYYSIKGISLSWGADPGFLMRIPQYYIIQAYPRVAFYVLLGILTWNMAYGIIIRSLGSKPTTLQRASNSVFQTRLPGIIIASLIGIFSFYMLFLPFGGNVFIFFTNPVVRAYLTSSTFGVGSILGYFWLYGVSMLPISSVVWLASTGGRKQKIAIIWWLHTIFSLLVIFIVSPRSSVVAYLISLLLAHHLFIKKVKFPVIIFIFVIIFIYVSITRIWRDTVGMMNSPTLQVGIEEVLRGLNIVRLFSFISSPNLADIRIFLLIEHHYGHIIPLKYGETLLRIFTQFIPRTIWPNKPFDLGVEIGSLYNPYTLSGSPPGFFAEMYMNFHVVGVIVGGLLLGAGLAVIYNAFLLKDLNPAKALLYVVLAPRIFLIPSSTFANILIDILITFFGVLMITTFLPKLFSRKKTYLTQNLQIGSPSTGGFIK